MEKLIDLKLTTKEKKHEYGIAPDVSERPDYPYWASLRLDKDTLKKLKVYKLQGGDEVQIKAVGKVASITFDDANEIDILEIQIQKMKIAPPDMKEMRKKIAKEIWE